MKPDNLLCPLCQAKIKYDSVHEGSRLRCPECKTVFDPSDQIANQASTGSDALVGQQLGNYEIIRKIGQGGMGTVYEAVQGGLDRRVALKVLSQKLVSDEAFVRRFQQEARAAALLEHPNIVSVYEIAQEGGTLFFSMPFIEGESLLKRIKREGPVPVDEALSIMDNVIDALEFAYGRGIIHRDIKPDNILLSTDGTIKVADLGLAKKIEDPGGLTDTGAGLGSPHYMAPEQGQGSKDLDCRADIYALGITFFVMLTGMRPYGGKSPVDVVMSHLNNSMPSACDLNQKLPQEADAVLAAMCAKSPNDRPPTYGELRQELAILKGAGQVVKTGLMTPVFSFLSSQPPGIAIGAIILTLIFICGGLWVNDLRQRARQETSIRATAISPNNEQIEWSRTESNDTEDQIRDVRTKLDEDPEPRPADPDIPIVVERIKIDDLDPSAATRKPKPTSWKNQATRQIEDLSAVPSKTENSSLSNRPTTESDLANTGSAPRPVDLSPLPVRVQEDAARTQSSSTSAKKNEVSSAREMRLDKKSYRYGRPLPRAGLIEFEINIIRGSGRPLRLLSTENQLGFKVSLDTKHRLLATRKLPGRPVKTIIAGGQIALDVNKWHKVIIEYGAGSDRIVVDGIVKSQRSVPYFTSSAYGNLVLNPDKQKAAIRIRRFRVQSWFDLLKAQLDNHMRSHNPRKAFSVCRWVEDFAADQQVRGFIANYKLRTVLPKLLEEDRNPKTISRRRRHMSKTYPEMVEVPADPILPSFYIDRCEITLQQYAKFMDYISKTGDHQKCHPEEPSGKDHSPLRGLTDQQRQSTLPVNGIDWFDAYAYAGRLRKRLPTIAEWRKAAQGADRRPYPWGVSYVSKSYNGNGQPVGVQLFPNGRSPYGCFQMAGNVEEWCYDRKRSSRGTRRPLCGGSFASGHRDIRTTSLVLQNPKERLLTAGFRCAKDPMVE